MRARYEYEVWWHGPDADGDQPLSLPVRNRLAGEKVARSLAGKPGVHSVQLMRRTVWELVYAPPSRRGRP